jgi:transcription-repair coupling factor (superfamily II helicase)
METATAASSAASGAGVANDKRAAERLRELAAHLNLHSGFSEVVASLEAGHGGTLGGVWGSSRALVAGALARFCPGPLVVVAPHPGEIDAIVRDLSLFTEARAIAFPAWESEPGERVLHDEVYGERLRVLKALGEQGFRIEERAKNGVDPRSSILVTSIQSLLQPVPSRDALAAATRAIRVGGRLDEQEFTRWLVERGAHSTSAVELPGEFSLRGGILDIFAPDADDPIRIELFGDEVESIRRFDVATQRSLAALDSATVTMLEPNASDRAHFTAYVPPGAWFMLLEPNELEDEGRHFLERMDRPQSFHSVRTTLEEIYKYPSVTAAGVPAGSMEATAHLEFESVERFSGEISKVRDELAKVSVGQEVFLVCETEAEVERLRELFQEREALAEPVAPNGEGRKLALGQVSLNFVVGHLEAGFRIVPQRVVLVSAAELISRGRRGGGSREQSTVFSNYARVTSSSTSRMASADIAGYDCSIMTDSRKST